MTDQIRVYAGECTAEYDGPVDRTACGHVVALVKPDDTVLVHDRGGYSPAVWLTRATSVDIDHDGQPRITAVDGDQRLTVRFHHLDERGAYSVGIAGITVGPSDTADRMGRYVRRRDSVVDVTTGDRYAIDRVATVLDRSCTCGLPLIRIDSTGVRCLDPRCGRSG